jgi:hypothetical protein|tara:strand:+ start:319 stop:486 length:168 start_codon:yes stop_codon:yes gene_type:complete
MNKFIKVLNDVHDFIVGGIETQPEVKASMGFSTEKPKRKYTRRKKTNAKKTTRSK